MERRRRISGSISSDKNKKNSEALEEVQGGAAFLDLGGKREAGAVRPPCSHVSPENNTFTASAFDGGAGDPERVARPIGGTGRNASIREVPEDDGGSRAVL